MRTLERLFSHAAAMGLLLALAGCAGMRWVDSDVSTFARWQGGVSGAPGTTFRFERLPSQELLQTGPSEMSQEQLEAAAVQALARRGLVHSPDAAVLVVQLGRTSVQQPPSYGPGPGPWRGTGISLGAGSAGSFVGLSFPMMRYEPPLYLRELSVVMRDSRSSAVVYETRARHSGVSANGPVIWPAMLEAALSGFPSPAAGARRVNVEVPR